MRCQAGATLGSTRLVLSFCPQYLALRLEGTGWSKEAERPITPFPKPRPSADLQGALPHPFSTSSSTPLSPHLHLMALSSDLGGDLQIK